MSPDSESAPGAARRTFLRWTSAVGLSAVAAGWAGGRRPTPSEPPPPDGDVSHANFADLPTVQRQVDRFRSIGDPTVLYNPALERRIERRPAQEAFDLVVRTVGERSGVEMADPFDRTIDGWRPTDREVEALAGFGDVGFVGEVATTTVTLRGVARGDVPEVAALPFVLAVARDPPLAVERSGTPGSGEGIPVADLRGPDYLRVTELPDDASIPSWLRIGIVDRGYGGAGDFAEAHAERVGIDEDLARDFTDEGDWRDDGGHGANVANTCASLLPDGHDDLFVPLKVVPNRRTPSRTDVRDALREAIEYAETNGVGVLNVSLGTSGIKETCPSAYCAELYSYLDAGFLPFAAVGNRNAEGVEFPGGERCSIGVGGVAEPCSDGYERFVDEDGYYGSSYGTVSYRDRFDDETHCHYCRHVSGRDEGFSPAVYGCYTVETDAGETLYGTSFASPQAAAVGAVMLGNGFDDYADVEATFRGMDRHGVCPDEVAEAGQLLDAERAYEAAVKDVEE